MWSHSPPWWILPYIMTTWKSIKSATPFSSAPTLVGGAEEEVGGEIDSSTESDQQQAPPLYSRPHLPPSSHHPGTAHTDFSLNASQHNWCALHLSLHMLHTMRRVVHSTLHILRALQVVRVNWIEQAAICSLHCTTNYPMVSLLPEFLLSLPRTHRQQWNLSTLSEKDLVRVVPTSHKSSNLAESAWQEPAQCPVLPGSATQSSPSQFPLAR